MGKYLAPSILAADFAKLGDEIKEVERAGATRIHVDVMDGLFVPSISFGMPVIKSIRKITDMVFDVHMMVQNPERYIDIMRKVGADNIVIHVEACNDVHAALEQIRQSGANPGIAFKPETEVESLRPYLNEISEIILMSVNPGFGGQSFIEDSYDKIRALAALRKELSADFEIEIDGGVKLDNIVKVFEAGADTVVVGSALFGSKTGENTSKLLDVIRGLE